MAEGGLEQFEAELLPLLDNAYTVARYLMRDEHDAQDVVQEAYLRALRYFDGFRGGDARVWLLTIVRNTCFTWKRRNRASTATIEYQDEVHGSHGNPAISADAALLEEDSRLELARALDRLPPDHREMLILREVEGLSYKDIARVVGVPMGTVMSRLTRARRRLQQTLGGAQEAG